MNAEKRGIVSILSIIVNFFKKSILYYHSTSLLTITLANNFIQQSYKADYSTYM